MNLKNKILKMRYFDIQQFRMERKLTENKGFEKELPLHRLESQKENSEINS